MEADVSDHVVSEVAADQNAVNRNVVIAIDDRATTSKRPPVFDCLKVRTGSTAASSVDVFIETDVIMSLEQLKDPVVTKAVEDYATVPVAVVDVDVWRFKHRFLT